MPGLEISEGQKFAIMAMPTAWIDPALPIETAQGEVRILRHLDVPVSEFWEGNLGALRVAEMREANLYLVAVADSRNPGILDGENSQLSDLIWRYYYGLVIAVDNISHGRLVRLSGADAGAGPSIRQVQEADATHFVLGCEKVGIGVEALETAQAVADCIPAFAGAGEYSRFWRITHAFYDGVRSGEAGYRTHQFVRCVEGLIAPEQGRTEKQFTSRTELFVGSRHHTVMKHLYKIRSSLEHLHGPLAEISAADERSRRLLLMERAVQAEAVARYAIRRLLTTASLQQHFETDESIAAFWALPDTERRAEWGPPMDLDEVRFDDSYTTNEDLGLD